MKQFVLLFAIASLAPLTFAAPTTKPIFTLNDGDRIAFIGNTFVEREQKADYIETMLISRFPRANVTFRNLGYSADTATGEARGLCAGWTQFEKPDKAFERLRKLVAEFKPTVLLINYGMTESFAGPEKLPDFVANYNKMLDALTAAAGGSPRIILMSPNYHEDLGKPLPDPSAHNRNLRLYSDAIGEIAAKRSARFIDLMSLTDPTRESPNQPFRTWNGIHLTAYGYWRVAMDVEKSLNLMRRYWNVNLLASGVPHSASFTTVLPSDVKALPDGIQFTALDDFLPVPPPPRDSPAGILDGSVIPLGFQRMLSVSRLKPGTYELKAGDELLAKGTDVEWAKGVNIKPGPAGAQAEALRAMLIAKDFDYFNYQRPDNDSYIFAFRKREQGRNAVEIPQFLPLVEEKEKQIAVLRVPKPVTYELKLVK